MRPYTLTGKKDTRSGFGDAMTELGRSNPDVVALCADLVGSLKLGTFIQENPDRFFQAGIAEANMIGVGAGLALGGKIRALAPCPVPVSSCFLLSYFFLFFFPQNTSPRNARGGGSTISHCEHLSLYCSAGQKLM